MQRKVSSIELMELPDHRERWLEQKREEKVKMLYDVYMRLHPIIEDIFIKNTNETPAVLFDRWLKKHNELSKDAQPLDAQLSSLLETQKMGRANRDDDQEKALSFQIVSLVKEKRKFVGVYGLPFIDIDEDMIKVLSQLASKPISDQKDMDKLGLTIAFSFPTPENTDAFLKNIELHLNKISDGIIALTMQIVNLKLSMAKKAVSYESAASSYTKHHSVFSHSMGESKDDSSSPGLREDDSLETSSTDESTSSSGADMRMSPSPTRSPRS